MASKTFRFPGIGNTERWTLTSFCVVLGLGFVLGQGPFLTAQVTPQGTQSSGLTPTVAGSLPTPTADATADEYAISSGDVLDVYVYDVPELSHSYTVNQAGTITVPLLTEPVPIAGLTADEAARALEQAFQQSGRLRRPEVAVSLKQSLAGSVAVEGAVRSPSIFPELGRVRLADILVQCGGLADDAGDVTISRGPLAMRALARDGGQPTPTLTLAVKKIMDVTDPASATAVWPGDRVVVDRQLADVYYVMGEVGRPGGYTLQRGHEELTVLRAIALAGNQGPTAKTSKVFIIRKDPSAPRGRDEITLDLKKIIKGNAPDPKLQADDILFVPGSAGKKALRTIESAPGLIVAGAGGTAIAAAH